MTQYFYDYTVSNSNLMGEYGGNIEFGKNNIRLIYNIIQFTKINNFKICNIIQHINATSISTYMLVVII